LGFPKKCDSAELIVVSVAAELIVVPGHKKQGIFCGTFKLFLLTETQGICFYLSA